MAVKSPWTDIKIKYKIYSNYKYKEIKDVYETPEAFENAVRENPYDMMINCLNKNFKAADQLIIQLYPELKESAMRCKWCCWHILKKNESEGDTCIDANVLAKIIKQDFPEVYPNIVPVIKEDYLFYYNESNKKVALTLTYNSEKTIAEAIKHRVRNPFKTDIDWHKYTMVDGLDLTDEQAEVLRLICEKSIVMLNGSAGTGKSSAMKALVTMLDKEGYGCTVLAPTGIAAKRIAEVSGHTASTIHKFIASKQEVQEFLIIDECSMIGVQLLGSLLHIVPDSTKIVMICDESQLASISCGNVVQDIINSGIVPIVKLSRVFRYGKGGIATIATDIRNGNKISSNSDFNDYNFIPVSKNPLDDVLNAYNALRETYAPEDIMILSPFNVRDSGTYAINSAVQSKYNDSEVLTSYNRQNTEIEFKVGDRLVNTENNYHMHGVYGDIAIMNGEFGIVKGFDGNLMEVEYESGTAYLEKEDIWKQLLGYSITVHKSQGSQTKAVIVVADKSHSFFLSRNLLYVAVSRAQKKLIVIGDVNTINNALKVQEEKIRETYLGTLLLS